MNRVGTVINQLKKIKKIPNIKELNEEFHNFKNINISKYRKINKQKYRKMNKFSNIRNYSNLIIYNTEKNINNDINNLKNIIVNNYLYNRYNHITIIRNQILDLHCYVKENINNNKDNKKYTKDFPEFIINKTNFMNNYIIQEIIEIYKLGDINIDNYNQLQTKYNNLVNNIEKNCIDISIKYIDYKKENKNSIDLSLIILLEKFQYTTFCIIDLEKKYSLKI
jgi:hypothetical protein